MFAELTEDLLDLSVTVKGRVDAEAEMIFMCDDCCIPAGSTDLR
jgi:hypothetical protein